MFSSRWYNDFPTWPRLSPFSRSLGFDDVFDDIERTMNDVWMRDPTADIDYLFRDLAPGLGLPLITSGQDQGQQRREAGDQRQLQQGGQQQQHGGQLVQQKQGGQQQLTTFDPWRSSWLSAYARAPAMDVIERDKDFQVTVDVPGVRKEDIKLQITQDRRGRHLLTVSGERKEEQENVQKGFRSAHRLYGQFSRSLRLPDLAKPENVQARYENGVLKVIIPKTEQRPQVQAPPPPQTIQVA